MEKWKQIKGFEELYDVSTMGNVINVRNGRLLKPMVTDKGYLSVVLQGNSKRKVFKVHRLVAETFIPNPTNLPQVNHIDEDKKNNNVENLEWCTNAYNTTYGNSKLKISKKVQCVETGEIFKSIRNAIESTGIHGIQKCCSGKLKTSGGFHWKVVY